MQKQACMGKRLLALVLALIMAMSTLTECLAATGTGGSASGAPNTSLGALLAEKYADKLTDGEKALLRSGYLAADKSYTYTPPAADNSGKLVEVNPDEKTVTAKTYTDSDFTWIPVKAEIMADGAVRDTVTLTESGGVYTGSFKSYTGLSYSVAVTYRMQVTADTAAMNKLLGAGAVLSGAADALKSTARGASSLESLLLKEVRFSMRCAMDNFGEKVNQDDYPLYQVIAKLNPKDGGLPYKADGSGGTLSISWDEEESAKGKALTDDIHADKKTEAGRLAAAYWNGTEVKDISTLTAAKAAALQTAAKNAQEQTAVLKKLAGMSLAIGNDVWEMVESVLESIKANLEKGKSYGWSGLDGLIKTGLTTAESSQLDALVNGLGAAQGATTELTVLTADETVVTAGVEQATVNMVVEATVYPKDAATTTALQDTGAAHTLRLAANTAETAAKTQLDAQPWEAAILNNWNATDGTGFSYDLDTTHYVRTAVFEPAVGAGGLQKGVTYTYRVTYTPQTYTVTAAGCDDIGPGPYGYGYTLKLPELADENQVYDYTVNDVSYDQGAGYRITGDTTITRKVSKKWEDHSLSELLVANYIQDASAAAAARDILKSSALDLGKNTFRLRTPADDSGLLSIAPNGAGGYTVTAKPYNANTQGLVWRPADGLAMNGSSGTALAFTEGADGSYTATATGDFDSVKVTYSLQLGWDDIAQGYLASDAQTILNLPYKLTQDARKQMAGMQMLVEQISNLEMLNANVETVNTVIQSDKRYGVSQAAKDAMAKVYESHSEEADGSRRMKIYPYVTAYQAAATNAAKLAHYYQNDTAIIREINGLYDNLSIVLKDDGVKMLIQGNPNTEPYYGKLDTIIKKLGQVKAALVPVDEHVNKEAGTLLTNLAAAVLRNAAKVQSVSVSAEPKMTTTLQAAAPSKLKTTLTVTVLNSQGAKQGTASETVTFDKDAGVETHTLTAEDIAALETTLNKAAAAAAAEASADLTYYEKSADSGTLPTVGTAYAGGSVSVTYVPKTYTATVDGEEITVTADNLTIQLPKCSEEGYAYEYTVGGVKLPRETASYTLTTAQLAALAAGTLTITRKEIDLARENVLKWVDTMNQAVVNRGMTYTEATTGTRCLSVAFIPVEDSSGKLSIVVRVSPDASMTADNLKKLAADLAQNLLTFSAVELNNETLCSGGKLYLQAMADMLLNSGISLSQLVGLITETGDINEWTALDGATVVGAGADGTITVGTSSKIPVGSGLMGGLIMQAPMKLGTREVQLCLTLEDFGLAAAKLKSLRSDLVSAQSKLDFQLAGGTAKVDITAPDKAYQVFLGGLLVLGENSLEDLGSFDLSKLEPRLLEMIKPVLQDTGVTGAVIQATLTKLGVTTDVSRFVKLYDKYIPVVRKALDLVQLSGSTGDAANLNATVNIDVKGEKGLVSLMGDDLKSVVGSIIVEDKLTGKAALTLKGQTHQAGDYAALVVGTQGAQLLTDLNTTIATDNTAVVLLKDSIGNLTITGENVLVDLRGKTLTGSIAGTAAHQNRVFVADSTLDSNGSGKVTGKVSNAVLTGGTYTGNTDEALLRGGYSKDASGRVTNDYYSIAVSGSTITVTLKATAQSLRDAQRATLPALAADLAADLALNYFSKAQQVTVDGKTLYAANVADITELFQSGKLYITNTVGNRLLDDALGYTAGGTGNYPGINYLLGDILTKLQDISGLKTAVDTGSPVATYTLGLTGWDVKLTKETGKDYLTVGVAGNGKTETQTLKVVLQSDSATNNTQMSDALGQLADIVTFDTPITMTLDRFTVVSGKTLQATVSGSGKLTVDMSSDPTYAVMMAVAVSGTLASGDALRTELNSAVVHYYTNNDVGKLKTALEKVTCAQVFAALKTIGLHTNFRALATQAGITDAATLTAIGNDYGKLTAYRGGMAGTGWLLKKLDITGSGTKLSDLKTAEYGTYTYSKDSYSVTKTFDAVKGWKVQGVANLSDTAAVTLKLFAVDKAIVVSDSTGKRVYNGDDLAAALTKANANDGSTVTLNGPVTMTRDEKLTAGVSIVNADKLTQGTYKLLLQGTGRLTSDSPLTVGSADPAHRVVTGTVSGKHTYTLAAYAIQYKQNGTTVYGDDLAAAMAAADKNTTVTVLNTLSLTADIKLGSKKHTLMGMAYVRMDGHQFVFDKSGSVLVVENGTVTADACAVDSALGSSYSIVSSVGATMTTYSLKYAGGGGGGGGGSYTGSYIYLDVQPSGINARQLQTAVRKYFNDNSAEVTVNSGLTAAGRVANGAGISVTGGHAGSYTVIIMGDTNCNGKIDSGDAVKMRNHYFGTATLSGVALEAADMNRNGKVDAGDAVKNRVKYQNWSGYRSTLKITV